MGAPVETGIENFEEVILALSASDRAKLIGWIAETMQEEYDRIPEKTDLSNKNQAPGKDSGDKKALGAIKPPVVCSPEQRSKNLDFLNGSWVGSENAEELIDTIYSSRTTNDREYLYNE